MRDSSGWTPFGVTLAGAGINVILAGGKIAAGIVFHCQTVLADGVHSLTDLVSDVAVLVGVRIGDRPADPSHPYGHRRVHTLTSLIIGVLLIGTGIMIGYRAIVSFMAEPEPIDGDWPLALALLTVPAKEWLYRWTRNVGRRVDNPSVIANAWHHRTDAFTSLAASAGIAGAMFLGPHWRVLDGVTALLLCGFLVVAAGRLIYDAAQELIDRAPDAAHLAALEQIVAETPGVVTFHACRARKIGGRLEMDLHVLVDETLSVREGHDIASTVKARIREEDPSVAEVVVHVEPFTEK